MNFLLKADPKFKKIYLCHPSLRSSLDSELNEDELEDMEDVVNEYKHIDYTPLYSLPTPKFFNDGCNKKCLIIDDMNLKNMNKEQSRNLSKIISYSSSHYNMTVFIATQDSFSTLPVSVLRFCNFFSIFRFSDICYLKMLLNRVGISKKFQDKIMAEMKTYDLHDFLCIDNTFGSPCRYRRNIYTPLANLLEE